MSAAAIAKPAHKDFYSREDMDLFNALEHPVYVFDIINKSMWWANHQAVKLWDAESLDSLLERDFAKDMSKASEQGMLNYLRRFEKGERARYSCTLYPNGVKTTTKETCSGIKIEPGRVAILCECDLVAQNKEDVDHASLRGVEMLRHLPIAVSQFDMNGTLIEQNPEALSLFGEPKCCVNEKSEDPCDCFSQRFVDQAQGGDLLKQVQEDGTDCSIEAQLYTVKGPRWYSIRVRKSIDVVSQEPCILYSARDITEVVNAKQEADRLNMEKNEMLAVLAHEIRTPLHQMIGYIDLLARMDQTPEQMETIRQLQSSSTALSSVVNDVLDLTKLEAGKMEIERIAFDPSAVCAGCVQTIESLAEEKGLALRCDVQSSIFGGLVMGDPNRIRQIILNFLSNAVKYTDRNGEITIKLKASPQSGKEDRRRVLTFSVKDTGIGISKEQRDRIFCKYFQATVSTGRQFGGTGLGLAICKCLAEAMGGSIEVQSELYKGAEFVVHIPVDVCDQTKNMPDLDLAKEEKEDLAPRQLLNVLVAEDNRVNQKLVVSMLKHVGHMATVVENGQEAVAEVENGTVPYDMILMDIQMPVMDGIEATKLIRSNGWTKSRLPIVGLTASFQTAQLKDYKKIGMNHCIAKPVRMKILKDVIETTNETCKKQAAPGFDENFSTDPTWI
eukprot:scaffold543_cov119-Cylindrotheca_fusiformis.AAC.34